MPAQLTRVGTSAAVNPPRTLIRLVAIHRALLRINHACREEGSEICSKSRNTAITLNSLAISIASSMVLSMFGLLLAPLVHS